MLKETDIRKQCEEIKKDIDLLFCNTNFPKEITVDCLAVLQEKIEGYIELLNTDL